MRRALLLMFLLSLLQGALAYAALERSPAEVVLGAPPQRLLGRTLAAVDDSAGVYTVRQTTLAGDTVVREYSDSQGKVFALNWSGPGSPGLPALLYEHFGVETSVKASARRPPPLRPDVVIVSHARQRAFSGRAWVPTALPAGFSADNIE